MDLRLEKHGKFLIIKDGIVKSDEIIYFSKDEDYCSLSFKAKLSDYQNDYILIYINCKDTEDLNDKFLIICEKIFSIFSKEDFLIGNNGIANKKLIKNIYLDDCKKIIIVNTLGGSLYISKFDSRKECKEEFEKIINELIKEEK